MSTTDSLIKLYQWWQEHLKSAFVSSSSINPDDHYQLRRRPSLISFRSMKNSQLINIKKRASYGGIDERHISSTGFRHVRDSIRGGKNHLRMASTMTNNKRRPFQKSTTCDITSEEILSNENKSTSMNRRRSNKTRRFSLIKLELPTGNSNTTKNEHRPTAIPSASPNLIQKLLFRQFSPKTRPYSLGVSSEDNVSPRTTPPNGTPINRQATSSTTKQSWTSLSSSSNSKQNSHDGGDNSHLSSSNKILSKSQQCELNAYLSRRRNTTGSISLNKIVDIKNTSSGNTLKLAAAVTAFNNSTNRISTENIFQTIEDSDLLTTKQLIQTNENIVNSYNEYDWCPLDIAVMLNNIPMIRLLLHYGAEESSKIQSEEFRYQSVCQQLLILAEQNTDEYIKKSSSNKLAPDDIQLRRLSPLPDKQQRHRRTSKTQQSQLNQQRTLTLSQMKDNYEQSGKTNNK